MKDLPHFDKKNLPKGSRKFEGNDEEETIHIQQFSGFG